jgi:hypothetical protein
VKGLIDPALKPISSVPPVALKRRKAALLPSLNVVRMLIKHHVDKGGSEDELQAKLKEIFGDEQHEKWMEAFRAERAHRKLMAAVQEERHKEQQLEEDRNYAVKSDASNARDQEPVHAEDNDTSQFFPEQWVQIVSGGHKGTVGKVVELGLVRICNIIYMLLIKTFLVECFKINEIFRLPIRVLYRMRTTLSS